MAPPCISQAPLFRASPSGARHQVLYCVLPYKLNPWNEPSGRNKDCLHFTHENTDARRGEVVERPGLPYLKMTAAHFTSGSLIQGHTRGRFCFSLVAAEVLWGHKHLEADGLGMEMIWDWSLQGHQGSNLGSSPVHGMSSPGFQANSSSGFNQRHLPAPVTPSPLHHL